VTSLAAGIDPATTPQQCRQGQKALGLAPEL
jgi:hypothetical protein